MLLSTILTVSILLSMWMSVGCGNGEQDKLKPADYGEYGKTTALAIVNRFPDRFAYSEQEKKAGLFIKEELIRMGYTVEEQVFFDPYRTKESTNYIVRIQGEGFMLREEGELYSPVRETVIVGAHYDVAQPPVPDQAPTEDTVDENTDENTSEAWRYDGIQANASGVACLLTLAAEIRAEKPAYDVVLVAFGAGMSDYQGARAFLNSMTREEKDTIDVMYCVDSIYAGDKLYASSGLSSLLPGKKYEYRRKLYEAYDVVYNHMLKSQNNVDLYYNMSGLLMDLNGDEIQDIYREVTLNRSDYVPFDEAGIPIVFFESFDYNATTLSEMKETKNLNLQEEGGMIRGTRLDSYEFLKEEIEPERLTTRINNTAYIIIEAIKRGAYDAVPVSSYNAGERLPPLIPVTETVPYQSKKQKPDG